MRDQMISPDLATPRRVEPPCGKYIGRLSESFAARPPARVVLDGCRAGNLEHPHVFVRRPGTVRVAPPQIMQCRLDRQPKSFVDALDEQRIQSRTLVDFVEVDQRASRDRVPANHPATTQVGVPCC